MSCKNKIKKMKKLGILTMTKRIKQKLIDKINVLKKILGGMDKKVQNVMENYIYIKI